MKVIFVVLAVTIIFKRKKSLFIFVKSGKERARNITPPSLSEQKKIP
jgi:hypothetical protein